MPSKWKIIAVVAIAGLLCWMAFGPSATQQRRKEINRALALGGFAKMGSRVSAILLDRMRQLCQAAGTHDTIVLNQPFVPGEEGKLHIFICTPADSAVTNCEKGNAVYDADVPAIFVDRSIFIPQDWLDTDVPPDDMPASEEDRYQLIQDEIPFNEIYAEFVILHELGHYTLNSGSAGAFDLFRKNSVVSRADELAADSFSLRHLTSFYQAHTAAAAAYLSKNMGVNIGLSGLRSVPGEPVLVGLVEMAHMSVLGKLLGVSPISPYYEDKAHPTFIVRLRNMLETILNQPALNDTVRQKAQYARVEMDAYLDLPSIPTTEIVSDDMISTVCFGPDKLLVSVFDDHRGSGLFEIPAKNWQAPATTLGAGPGLSLTRNQSVPSVAATNTNWVSYSWYGAREGFVAAKIDGQLFTEAEGWRSTKRNLPELSLLSLRTLYYPPEPSEAILGISREKDEAIGNGRAKKTAGERLFLISGTAIKAQLGENSPRQAVKAALHVDSVSIYFKNCKIIDSMVYVPFGVNAENSEQLKGVVCLQSTDLSVARIDTFNFDGLDPFLYNENGLVEVPNAHAVKRLLVMKNQPVAHGYYDSWSVWELSISDKPRKIGDYPFIAAAMPESPHSLSFMFWDEPSLNEHGLQWVPPNHLVISWNNDAIYNLDLETGMAKRFFYPGGEEFELKAGKDGYLAAYAAGTKHMWVFKLK